MSYKISSSSLGGYVQQQRYELVSPIDSKVVSIERLDSNWSAIALYSPWGVSAEKKSLRGVAVSASTLIPRWRLANSNLDLENSLSRFGARLQSIVDWDMSVLILESEPAHMERLMDFLSDVLPFPSDCIDLFEYQRATRIKELSGRREGPSATARRILVGVLYGKDHPYASQMQGTPESLARLTLDDVSEFYTGAYSRDFAWLFSSNARGHGAVERLKEISTALPANPMFLPLIPDPTPTLQPGTFLCAYDTPQAFIAMGAIVGNQSSESYPALLLINLILGGHFNSRLNRWLRVSRSIAYGVDSAFDFRRNGGHFIVKTTVDYRHVTETIIGIRECLRLLRSDLVEEDLRIAKLHALHSLATQSITATGACMSIIDCLAKGISIAESFQLVNKINGLTLEDLNCAYEQHFLNARFSTVIVGRKDQLKGTGAGETVPIGYL